MGRERAHGILLTALRKFEFFLGLNASVQSPMLLLQTRTAPIVSQQAQEF
jgi:hypothetical protein